MAADESTSATETAAAEKPAEVAAAALGADPPQEIATGETAARKADGVKPQTAPKPGPSTDDHYTRGRKAAERHIFDQLEERFGVRDFDALAARLGASPADDDEPGESGKAQLPDVRELKRSKRKLEEEHATMTTKYERASARLASAIDRVKRESLKSALVQAGAIYPDDEAALLLSRIGVSSEWEAEEIDAKGAPTGRTIAQIVAERREQRPDSYRGESREGTGSRPARSMPTTSNGKTEMKGDPTSAASIREALARHGIT